MISSASGSCHRSAHVEGRGPVDPRLELHHREGGDLRAGGRGERPRAGRQARRPAVARQRASAARSVSRASTRAGEPDSRPGAASPRPAGCAPRSCSPHPRHSRDPHRASRTYEARSGRTGRTRDSSNPRGYESAFQEGQERRPGATKARWRPVLPLSRRCEKNAPASQAVHPGTSSMGPRACRRRRGSGGPPGAGRAGARSPARLTTSSPKSPGKRPARSSDHLVATAPDAGPIAARRRSGASPGRQHRHRPSGDAGLGPPPARVHRGHPRAVHAAEEHRARNRRCGCPPTPGMPPGPEPVGLGEHPRAGPAPPTSRGPARRGPASAVEPRGTGHPGPVLPDVRPCRRWPGRDRAWRLPRSPHPAAG